MTPITPLPAIKSNGKTASCRKEQASEQGTRLDPEVLGFIWGSATELLFDLGQVTSILISISLLQIFFFFFFLIYLNCKLLEETMASYCVLRGSAEGKGKRSAGLNSM